MSRPFNNVRMTKLLNRYSRHKKDLELRNKIIEKTMPLIGAAMSKMHLKNNREDIRQECALKILLALPKYDSRRGDAFGFFWTVICNTCRTHAERLGRRSLSLSNDDIIKHEAEISAEEAFETPENQHVLNDIAGDLIKAMNNGDFLHYRARGHKRACRTLSKAIATGDLFFDKNKTMHKLRRIGLSSKDVQHYYDYSIVHVRMQLLRAKENILAISHPKIGKAFSTVIDSGDI